MCVCVCARAHARVCVYVTLMTYCLIPEEEIRQNFFH